MTKATTSRFAVSGFAVALLPFFFSALDGFVVAGVAIAGVTVPFGTIGLVELLACNASSNALFFSTLFIFLHATDTLVYGTYKHFYRQSHAWNGKVWQGKLWKGKASEGKVGKGEVRQTLKRQILERQGKVWKGKVRHGKERCSTRETSVLRFQMRL